MTLDEASSPFLTEVTLDLASGAATVHRLPGAAPGDFPVVPPSLVGEASSASAVLSLQPQLIAVQACCCQGGPVAGEPACGGPAAGTARPFKLTSSVRHITPCLPPGRPTRYTYVGAMEAGPLGEPRFVGVTKYDLSKARGAAHC